VWINCIGLNINCAKVEKYTIYLYAAAFENSTIPRNARFVIGVITRWTLFFNSYRKSGVYFMPSDWNTKELSTGRHSWRRTQTCPVLKFALHSSHCQFKPKKFFVGSVQKFPIPIISICECTPRHQNPIAKHWFAEQRNSCLVIPQLHKRRKQFVALVRDFHQRGLIRSDAD